MTDLRGASEEYLMQLGRDEIEKYGEVKTWEAAEALDRAQHRRSAKIDDSAVNEAVKSEAELIIQRNRTREMQKVEDTRRPKYYARHFINAAKKRQYKEGKINLQEAVRLVPIYKG